MGRLNWWKTACAVWVLCAATAIVLPAQTLTTLQSFDNTNGADPVAGLVQATNGNLYGTTQVGGANTYGTVFRMTPSGTLTTIYSFAYTDGYQPFAALVQGADGNFYGTTSGGGTNTYGTVFKITPGGTLTTLYNFCSETNCADGLYPEGALIQATNGNFYGTTSGGGANETSCNLGCGTVFKITSTGTLTTLHSFCSESNCTDGANPYAALLQASDGNFYGTTGAGGTGSGTVFKITPGGTLTTLHSFDITDGLDPAASLVQGTSGSLYGTTSQGGSNGYGTVFKITTSGTLTTLISFDLTDGDFPDAPLIQATDGNFYGTTILGGANDSGTIFEISPSGTLKTVYNFCSKSGCADGQYTDAPLMQDTNGAFYGTTLYGGAHDDGTVFSLSVGLGAFVETEPTSGAVGRAVKILGTSLKGATSVTFNGTAAVFTVESSSLIQTTVPTGATSGKVQVVTPGGTLTSNVSFRVLP